MTEKNNMHWENFIVINKDCKSFNVFFRDAIFKLNLYFTISLYICNYCHKSVVFLSANAMLVSL